MRGNCDNRTITWTCAIALLALALISSACAAGAAPTPTPTKPPAATAAPTQAASKPTAAAPATPAVQATPAPKSSTAAKTVVRFGSPGSTSDAGVYIGIERKYFEDLGLDVQLVPFQSGPMMIAPLASGDLEVGGGAISPGLMNAIERGVALKLVAGKGSSIDGWNYAYVTARKDLIDSGQLKEIKDLKGKKAAIPAAKGTGEAIIAYLLKKGGLTINDMELVPVGYFEMLAAYANKSIDIAVQIEPAITEGVDKGLAVRWPHGAISGIYGGEYQGAPLIYSEQFAKNTDAARRFMIGYIKGLRDYNDALVKNKGKKEVVDILIKYTPLKAPALYDQIQHSYLEPNGKMDLNSMKMDLDYYKLMGYYPGKLELGPLTDNQFVEYALKELGPYK